MRPVEDQAATLLATCRAAGVMIVTAESCTGGLLSAAFTAIPGSSDVFDRGFITYSYAAKSEMLGVSARLLADHGAVSEQVAAAMTQGALERTSAGLALAITGVAGPGASEAKPEGLVWFSGQRSGQDPVTLCREFGPLGRSAVRAASVQTALDLGQSVL